MADNKAGVWIVFGESGEYSERTRWPVAAYIVEAGAVRHCAVANHYEHVAYARKDRSTPSPYDPDCFRTDGRPIVYTVEYVPRTGDHIEAAAEVPLNPATLALQTIRTLSVDPSDVQTVEQARARLKEIFVITGEPGFVAEPGEERDYIGREDPILDEPAAIV